MGIRWAGDSGTSIDEAIDADVDAVAVVQQCARHRGAVDQGAVAAAQILDHHVLLASQQHGVFARDGQVIKHQGIGGTPANDRACLRQPIGTQRLAGRRQRELPVPAALLLHFPVLVIGAHLHPLTPGAWAEKTVDAPGSDCSDREAEGERVPASTAGTMGPTAGLRAPSSAGAPFRTDRGSCGCRRLPSLPAWRRPCRHHRR